MRPRLLGSLCIAAAALPVAIHLRFASWEVWCFALLVGVGVYLLSETFGGQEVARSE